MKALKFVLVLAAFALAASSSEASTIWTVTARGEINGGIDSSGIFGTPGMILGGREFSQTIIVNTDPSKWSKSLDNGVSYQWLNGEGPSFTTNFTIDGHNAVFKSISTTYGLQMLNSMLSHGSGQDEIYTSNAGWAIGGDYLEAGIDFYSHAGTPFLPSYAFTQSLNARVDTSMQAFSNFRISGTVSAYFNGVVDSISISGTDDSVTGVDVPEPSTISIIGLGLLGLGFVCRKRKFILHSGAKVKPASECVRFSKF